MIVTQFPAMGTQVEVLLDAAPSSRTRRGFAAVRGEVARLEALLSRFRPDSALSRLNDAGSAVADPELWALVEHALRLRDETGGAFDPAVGAAVVAAGYDRDFSQIGGGATAVATAVPVRGAVRLSPGDRRIALDDGVRLDLGAIAKGYAADRACSVLATVAPALVSVGGDCAVTGPRADGAPWAVGVTRGDGRDHVVHLWRGGLATSGVDRRRWQTRDGMRTHIVDAQTGMSPHHALLRSSVVAGSAAEADALATAVMVAGDEGAERWASHDGRGALIVDEDGGTRLWGCLR